MASSESLFEMCLQEAHLGHYSSSFQGRGIGDLETLATLSMQEYNSYGVTLPEDEKQLFRLIHILRNLDLNKLSDLNGVDQQQVISNESSTPNSMSHKEKTSHHGNKKAIKNHHNNLASQSGRNSEIYTVQLDERMNNSHSDHHRPKLSDTPRNSVLNRTFDKDDESDKDGDDGSVTMETVYSEAEKKLNNGVNDSQVQVLEHSNSGYNYGVPSASPTTQHKLKSGVKAATVSAPHSRNGAKVDEKIKVCVRKRPMNQKEWRAGEGDAVSIEGASTAMVKERKLTVDLTKIIQVHKYHFDEVFHETCSNEEVYERTAKPLIHTIFNRGKATCFAYGQTGAGKTHTLLGGQGGKVKGLYLLAAEDIFTIIRSSADYHGVVVYVSYFEIYCGQLCDLLNNRERLHARENAHHKVCIAGLNEIRVNGPQALMQVVESGNRVRVVGVSGVNADSSRSHAILQIQLKDRASNHIGKFSFIDLAGSERACDMSDPDKITRQEGAEINTSLLALKECIRALDQEKRHTPFRQSKLTQVLRDSFLGQSRTCMIACVSPNASAVDHTLNTLRYADRVKELRQAGELANTPTAESSVTIATKHPPTPSNFSPGSTSTPQKIKRSKQDNHSSPPRGSPKKKGDTSRRKSAVATPGKSTGRARMETRRKSEPDTSPTKSPPGADSGSKFTGRKSASHHNLQKSSATNGQSKVEKKNRGDVQVVQKLKYEQVSSGSKSSEKRKVIQSGVKVRENRTLEERKMRASANRSRYEDMNLSLGNDTPSKRTPEVRARMKKAFLNSSLPVWDLNQQENEVPSPPKPTPPPQKLEFENPRYVESPSKEKPRNDDQRTWAQKVADESNVSIPYRFDIPNPRFSQRQESVEDIESGYIPDMDTEVETPRSETGDQNHNDITSDSQEQAHKSEKASGFEDNSVFNRQDETSVLMDEVQEVKVSSKSNAFSKESRRRSRTPSSESRPSSRSDSSSTVELLAEIERSLQRSPIPVTPKPGSEPWMRVISEDKFHGSLASPSESPRSPGAGGSSRSAKKELFGAEKQSHAARSLRNESVQVKEQESHGRHEDPEGFREESPIRMANQTNNARLGDVDDAIVGNSRADSEVCSLDNRRPSHVLKEKLHHSGFSQKELFGDAVSPQIVQETQSENLQMHNRSVNDRTDVRMQSFQTGHHPQTRSAWGDGSVDSSRPTVQPAKGTSSSDQFVSAQSHIPISPYDSQSTNYATPAGSRLGLQRTAVSSTPKAFKHESLGMDSSLLHMSLSTIQSPGKGAKNPSTETNESFTTARETLVNRELEGSGCEEVTLPLSPRLTLTKSKSDGNLMRISPSRQSYEGESGAGSPRLKPPQRPAYHRQNSAMERASTCNLSSSSTAHPNNQSSTRDLLLAAHAEQLEETLRLCETGWGLIAQLRTNQMDVPTYMAQAGDLLDSHVWCLDTFRDQLNSFSRCSTPNN